MITDVRQPGFVHEQRPLPPSPPEHAGELLQGIIKDVTKSMSLGNPPPPEDEDEMCDSQDGKPEPESSRGTYYMLETEPGAQEALEESERGIGPKVVPARANYTPQNGYKDYDEILKVRQSLTCQIVIKEEGLEKQTDDSSIQVRSAKPILRIKKTKKKRVADCKGKTKAGGIADPLSRGVAVEIWPWPCRICERNDHHTTYCPYKISIQPGEKISSEAAMYCKCCHLVGVHTDGSDDRVGYYYAALKYCVYCHAVGQHVANRYEDCPDVEDKERVAKTRDEVRKNWGKRGAEPAGNSTLSN